MNRCLSFLWSIFYTFFTSEGYYVRVGNVILGCWSKNKKCTIFTGRFNTAIQKILFSIIFLKQ